MFTTLKKYNDMEIKYQTMRLKYRLLVDEWDKLVSRINKKGGEEFLIKGQIHKPHGFQQLNQKEIRDLISLCHPDKHNNSDKANRITQRLLELRQ